MDKISFATFQCKHQNEFASFITLFRGQPLMWFHMLLPILSLQPNVGTSISAPLVFYHSVLLLINGFILTFIFRLFDHIIIIVNLHDCIEWLLFTMASARTKRQFRHAGCNCVLTPIYSLMWTLCWKLLTYSISNWQLIIYLA